MLIAVGLCLERFSAFEANAQSVLAARNARKWA